MDENILVTRSYMPNMDEYIEEIRPIWDSHWLTNMGVKHKALQAELQKYMGVPNVELLTNGHMALELSLQAMNLQGEGHHHAVYLCVHNPRHRAQWTGTGILRYRPRNLHYGCDPDRAAHH